MKASPLQCRQVVHGRLTYHTAIKYIGSGERAQEVNLVVDEEFNTLEVPTHDGVVDNALPALPKVVLWLFEERASRPRVCL